MEDGNQKGKGACKSSREVAREESVAKTLHGQLAALRTGARGMAMPEVLLAPGREKGSPGEVMQSALSKIRT